MLFPGSFWVQKRRSSMLQANHLNPWITCHPRELAASLGIHMFFEKGGGGRWVGGLSTLDGTTRYHKKDPCFICHLHSAGGVGTTWGWGATSTSERFYPWAITVNGREDFCGKKRHGGRKHFHCYFSKKVTVLVSTRACSKAKDSKAPQDMQAGMFRGKQGVPSQLRPG